MCYRCHGYKKIWIRDEISEFEDRVRIEVAMIQGGFDALAYLEPTIPTLRQIPCPECFGFELPSFEVKIEKKS